MKHFLLAILSLLATLGIAQDTDAPKHGLSLGLNVSPNYNYHRIGYNDDFTGPRNRAIDFDEAAYGFNAGISAQYRIRPRIELDFGLQYSRYNMRQIAPYIEEGAIGESDFRYRFYYLETQLRLNYRFIDKRVFAYLSAGFSMNIFLADDYVAKITHSDGRTSTDKSSETGVTDINAVGLSYLVGFGVGYHLSDKVSLRMEPLLRSSFSALSDTPILRYNRAVGCQLGIYMQW